MARPLFLGLDLSTQQLKAVILDSFLSVVHSESVHFGREFPQFGTEDGSVRDPRDASRIFTPVSLWLAAIDLLLTRLSSHSHFSLDHIQTISGTAQQHGTVYWNGEAEGKLGTMEGDKSIEEALKGCFSKEESPIWMDSSTGEFVDKFDRLIPNLSSLTGSRAYHRFSGMQIAKIFKYERAIYDATSRISLISSFLASILIGKIAPIDLSDGCGMNLLDIQTLDWSPLCLSLVVDSKEADLTDLRSKLGQPVPSSTPLGPISPFFVSRFGFSPQCSVVAFTGDNLSSMADLNVGEGDVIVSLGTSDTAIYCSSSFSPLERGHVFIHPATPGHFIYLICYKNGSLTRERIREACSLSSWHSVSEALRATPVGNNGCIGIYFDLDEIEPRVSKGDYRWNEKRERVESFPSPTEIRAVLESQCLHLRANCPRKINRVILTGGASANPDIRQMMADVFARAVFTAPLADSAAQGGAKRAAYVHNGSLLPYSEYFKSNLALVAEPIEENVSVYANLLSVYRTREASLSKPTTDI